MGGCFCLMAPLDEPQASIDLMTEMDEVSPSGTWPKTTWRPSNQEVITVVTKNWEPLLQRDMLAPGRHRGHALQKNLRVGASVGHRKEEGFVVGELEVLVGELLAVDALAAGALNETCQWYAQSRRDKVCLLRCRG